MIGAYKAMVRDYDLDGDLDIAAVSFSPTTPAIRRRVLSI